MINLRKTNPKLFRAKALRIAFRKLGLQFHVEVVESMMENNNVCIYCGLAIKPLDFSIDHKQPTSRGGTNELSNLHLICKSCNNCKGNLNDAEFKSLMAFLSLSPEMYKDVYRRLRMANYRFFFVKKVKV